MWLVEERGGGGGRLVALQVVTGKVPMEGGLQATGDRRQAGLQAACRKAWLVTKECPDTADRRYQ